MEYVTAAGLAGLHNLPALKRLVLKGLHCEISASAVPAFTQLTALTCLKLRWTINRPCGDFRNRNRSYSAFALLRRHH